jgi:hypothetical protein
MDSREYKHKEAIRFIRSKPLVCQPIMKNYFQCVGYYHHEKNQDLPTVEASCLEKFNFQECFTENKERLKENWIFNAEEFEG